MESCPFGSICTPGSARWKQSFLGTLNDVRKAGSASDHKKRRATSATLPYSIYLSDPPPHSNLTRTRLANDAGDKIELRCGNRIEGRVVKTSEWECATQVGMEEGSASDESDGRIAPHLADFES